MKILAIICCLLMNELYAQDTGTSCIQRTELVYTTPQPRLNDRNFTISINLNKFTDLIIDSIQKKIQGKTSINRYDKMSIALFSVNFRQPGKYTIPSVEYNFNNCRYVTNEINYEVIEALPAVDSGLWIRFKKDSDSTFWIMKEQKIPETETDPYKVEKGKEWYRKSVWIDIKNLPPGIRFIDGVGTQTGGHPRFIQSSFQFLVTDRTAVIRITKDFFKNLPEGYEFTDFVF